MGRSRHRGRLAASELAMARVLTIVGTRPEAIKMAPVIRALKTSSLGCRVCVTAQHREMLDQVLQIFEIKPDIDLALMQRGQTLPDLTARVLTAATAVLRKERPDVVLVQGDTTSAMAASLAAFYEKIPVGHIEAGLRTFNRYNPFPEEANRCVLGILAEYHFPPTQAARDALRAENVPDDRIVVTGNTVIDALHWVVSRPPSDQTRALLIRLGLTGNGRDPLRTILVTAHRRENFGERFESLCEGLRAVVERNPDVRLIYPVHLNPNVRAPVERILSGHVRIHLLEPLAYEPFVHLMNASYLVLSDSGGIQEEAPALGKPVLVMREETERPEAVEAGTARLVGPDRDRIVMETERLLHDLSAYQAMARAVSPFGDGHAAERIVQVLLNRLKPSAVVPAPARNRAGNATVPARRAEQEECLTEKS